MNPLLNASFIVPFYYYTLNFLFFLCKSKDKTLLHLYFIGVFIMHEFKMIIVKFLRIHSEESEIKQDLKNDNHQRPIT